MNGFIDYYNQQVAAGVPLDQVSFAQVPLWAQLTWWQWLILAAGAIYLLKRL